MNHVLKVECYVVLSYIIINITIIIIIIIVIIIVIIIIIIITIICIYNPKKQLFNSLRVLRKVSLVFIMINKLNQDQPLILIKQ